MVGQILSHNRAIQVLNFIGVRKFGHPIFSVPDIIFICFPIEHSSNEWFLFREPVPPILWTFTKLWNFISWWFVFFNFLFCKIFRKFFFPPLNMFYLDQVGVIWIKFYWFGLRSLQRLEIGLKIGRFKDCRRSRSLCGLGLVWVRSGLLETLLSILWVDQT